LVLLLGVGPLFASAAPGPTGAQALRRQLDEIWAFRLQADPLFATAMGEHRYDDRLPTPTHAEFERQAAFLRAARARLRALPRRALSVSARIDLDLQLLELDDLLLDHEFGAWRQPLNADSGFHTEFAQLPSRMRFEDIGDYRNYIARLRAFPAYVGQQVALLREGLRDGFSVPAVTLAGYDEGIAAHVVDTPEASVFWEPFRQWPARVPEAQRAELHRAGREAVRDGAVAGYRQLLEFMRNEYLPGARASTAAADLPRGRAYYAALVKRYTTLDVSPEQVHRIGLDEVARIAAEMQAVRQRTGFEGEAPAFLEFLRSDARFHARTPEALLKEAAWIAKRMDGKLPELFGHLPRLPYGLAPVPAALAPKYTGGRYVEAPADGRRAGTYWLNTYALESRPLYTLEALTFHEAVPGHHLQIALQRELSDVPPFRRNANVTAFVEGWALYAERLGLEVGFYQDPYADFGRLTYEMWRACRLVVDTGLHALGWSRQQALDYLRAHTALSHHEIGTEVDRYISWPGQALAYKMGELKIRALRAEAEQALGPRFDRRAFHDVVLAQGALPLPLLEQQVRAWIATRAHR
jgi:uncharacterized protein (DUF885 family)